MSVTSDLMSALAANRKQLFDLVAATEQQCACEIDEFELHVEIDSNYSGREKLTEHEAQSLLLKCSRPKPLAVVKAAA